MAQSASLSDTRSDTCSGSGAMATMTAELGGHDRSYMEIIYGIKTLPSTSTVTFTGKSLELSN